MNRPISGNEKKTFRLNMLLEPRELAELDEFRYTARIASRAEAIRTLIRLGLEAVASQRASSKEN